MKRLFKLPVLLAWGFWLHLAIPSTAQVCDNMVMDFDGNADFISLNTSNTLVNGDANFTVECWFSIASPPTACGNNFRRLVTLAGTIAPISRFEVGECNGQLKLYWSATNGMVVPPDPGLVIATISGALSQDCHHLAIVRNGAAINFYLDGASTPIYSGVLTGAMNTNLFRIGHWGGGATGGQDWLGTVDEVRLWSGPRSVQEIQDFKDCTLSGTSTGLVANWTFDQGPLVTPGGNNTGSAAIDMSGNGNNGIFSTVPNGFALSGTTSNFVCSPCPERFLLDISDQISLFPVLLASICAGEKVHFCVSDNGNNYVAVPAGSMVMWESSDNGAPWGPDPDLPSYAPAANALCFPVKKGIITNPNCNSIGPGFVDRRYRAKIVKKSGPPGQQEICTETITSHALQICCPPTCGNITIVPNIQPPWCEGDVVTMSVFLNPCDPWLPFAQNAIIDWCLIDGSGTPIPLPQYQNQLAFGGLQIPVGPDDICLQAKIYHCSCPPIVVEKCFGVDPLPVCGTIDVVQPLVGPIQQVGPQQYVICPGYFTALEMVNPAAFQNCTPVWQYHFGPPVPAPNSPGWTDLGSTNPMQNTNTLPQLNWPPGATCIYYRIECRPESWPNSGCDPCHSNMVTICLQPAPPSGTISGATQFCEGGGTTLTITPNPNPPGPWNYCWYWNGVLEQCFTDPVNTFFATKPGCYWVEIHDWCQITKVGPYCVEECVLKPKIECPTDNPCACDGLPITLNGCNSMYTCANTGPLPLEYTWTANGNIICSGPTCCQISHTPDPINGTTYVLTIYDPNLGCSGTSKPLHIDPCN